MITYSSLDLLNTNINIIVAVLNCIALLLVSHVLLYYSPSHYEDKCEKTNKLKKLNFKFINLLLF